jgi:hypothetical protein
MRWVVALSEASVFCRRVSHLLSTAAIPTVGDGLVGGARSSLLELVEELVEDVSENQDYDNRKPAYAHA